MRHVEDSLEKFMVDLGQRARSAARVLALASTEQKNIALREAAKALRRHMPAILAANAQDMEAGKANSLSQAMLDRLLLTQERVDSIAKGVEQIADLPDPVGRVLAHFSRPNGLEIDRVATPLGVVGVIYESRPNVTADAGALCLKAGNASILRGGSDSRHSSAAIHACLQEGLRAAHLPEDCVIYVPTPDRAAVGHLLRGLGGHVDVIVPRGGKALVARVQEEARVPVFAHLEGIVHLYIHTSAPLEMAVQILINAKLRRTGICGAAETLLVDQECAATHLAPLVHALLERGCEVRGDAQTCAIDTRILPAKEEDWRTEYLDRVISCKVVANVDAAIEHIETYGSHHTDAIVAQDQEVAERFLREVDSAIVLHNASTQFADGGEFGFGAEIGIATGRMHARGPVGLEQLTSFNYRVRGHGQIRPE